MRAQAKIDHLWIYDLLQHWHLVLWLRQRHPQKGKKKEWKKKDCVVGGQCQPVQGWSLSVLEQELATLQELLGFQCLLGEHITQLVTLTNPELIHMWAGFIEPRNQAKNGGHFIKPPKHRGKQEEEESRQTERHCGIFVQYFKSCGERTCPAGLFFVLFRFFFLFFFRCIVLRGSLYVMDFLDEVF